MILKHKNRYKPLYKQFIKLKENIQNRKKVLNFRKHKWQLFIKNYKQKLKYYRKFKPNDPVQYLVSKYPTKNLSYRNRYKTTLGDSKKLRLVYGGLSKKKVKKLLKILTKKTYKEVNLLFLKLLDYRLDVVLYKAKFATSIRNAQQFIMHNKILVNKKIIKIKSYLLKPGDFITVKTTLYNSIKINIQDSEIWPIPPKHLTINYKTLQIVVSSIENTNFSQNFFYNLRLERILTSYKKH